MGTGKFTLYRNTHGKAKLWFAGLLAAGFLMALIWQHVTRVGTCVAEPQMLGRFVVTPNDARFVRLPTEWPVLARHQAVKCG